MLHKVIIQQTDVFSTVPRATAELATMRASSRQPTWSDQGEVGGAGAVGGCGHFLDEVVLSSEG